MGWLAAAAPYISAAGTAIGAISAAEQQEAAGKLEERNAQFRAQQMEENANAEAAASQREAIQARRESNYLQSRTRALAAASGGGASDPTVVRLIGGIADEGEYNALTALYNGQSTANNMRTNARLERMQGTEARKAGKARGQTTILQGASTLARYG